MKTHTSKTRSLAIFYKKYESFSAFFACFILLTAAGPFGLAVADASSDSKSQIVRGRSNYVLDSVGNALSIPQKVVLLNSKIDNHDVSPATEVYVRRFIEDHPDQMKDVKVRINQWDPAGELDRLASNKRVSWWWRIFPGIPTTLWTSLTGRFLGGDNYNPFTNTISLYSDSTSVALHEAGHAYDFNSKVGGFETDLYAIGRILPPVALYQEFTATDTALHYVKEKKDTQEELKGYHTLYPAFGTYGGEYAGLPYGSVLGAGVGHGVGAWKAHERKLTANNVTMGEVKINFNDDPVARSLLAGRETDDAVLYNNLVREAVDLNVELLRKK